MKRWYVCDINCYGLPDWNTVDGPPPLRPPLMTLMPPLGQPNKYLKRLEYNYEHTRPSIPMP